MTTGDIHTARYVFLVLLLAFVAGAVLLARKSV